MKWKPLHINCDLGEGFPYDRELMPLVNQVNIACGGHAGSPFMLSEALHSAREHSCAVGAHPGYEDPANFGRKSLHLKEAEFKDQLRRQLDLFAESVEKASIPWHHVKPHGALYHDVAQKEAFGEWFLQVLITYPVKNIFLDKASATAVKAEQLGIRVWQEAFLDRGYDQQGRLLPRSSPGAVITDMEEARKQCAAFLQDNRAETYCVHGDFASSLESLRYLHQFFPTWGYRLTK